jgi:HlyD family secretion protein
VTAPVKKFYVQRGARVHAGELLATLENSDLAAAALDNKGSYTAAQATFDTATKATAPEDLTRAKLDLAQAKANLDLSQSIVMRGRSCSRRGAIPGATWTPRRPRWCSRRRRTTSRSSIWIRCRT